MTNSVLQIIIENADPDQTCIKEITGISDVMWINSITLEMFKFDYQIKQFEKIHSIWFEYVGTLNYQKFIVLEKSRLLHDQEKLDKLNDVTGISHIVTSNDPALFIKIPTNITVVDANDKLIRVLFNFLIKEPSTTREQLLANILNSANIFESLICENEIWP